MPEQQVSSQTATLSAGVASSIDIPVLGYGRALVIISNTHASAAIETNELLLSADGSTFAENTAAQTALGEIAALTAVPIEINGLCAKTLRIRMTASSNSSAAVLYVLYEQSTGEPAIRVAGSLVGAQTLGSVVATSITTDDLTTVDDVTVGDDLAVTGDGTIGGTLGVTGDVSAAGGFRCNVGVFDVTLAADQTTAALKRANVSGAGWVAPFAGSVMGVSGSLSAAITGASKTLKVRVYKALAADITSFSLLNAALDLDYTTGGAEISDRATAAKDAYTFAAGDVLKLVYTTTTITNTPTFTGDIVVEF